MNIRASFLITVDAPEPKGSICGPEWEDLVLNHKYKQMQLIQVVCPPLVSIFYRPVAQAAGSTYTQVYAEMDIEIEMETPQESPTPAQWGGHHHEE